MEHFLIPLFILAAFILTWYRDKMNKKDRENKKKVDFYEKTYIEYVSAHEKAFRDAINNSNELNDRLNKLLEFIEYEKQKEKERKEAEERKRQNGNYRNGRTS